MQSRLVQSRPVRSQPRPHSSSVQSRPATSNKAATVSHQNDLANKKREVLRQFIRYLVLSLERRGKLELDPRKKLQLERVFNKAKGIIKDCTEKNQRRIPGYESVTEAVKKPLFQLVGEKYYKKAYDSFRASYKKEKSNQEASAGPRPGTATRPLPNAGKRSLPNSTNNAVKPAKKQRVGPGTKGSKTPAKKKTVRVSKSSPGSSTPTSDVPSKSSNNTKSTGIAMKVTEPVEEPPREFKELMEAVDHSIDYDFTTAGLLLGSKGDIQLTEEQRKLLYKDTQPPKPTTTSLGPRPGWGKRNVVSVRAAWARTRLREKKRMGSAPVVGGGLLTLPSKSPATAPADKTMEWVNEEVAEQDTALALLSEGCEIYLKGILEKAIHCARQRQNLDGIRLWHQQHSSSTNTTKPALSLRLGCDVSRQVSQAAGNAALTCKRMEEALERQSGIPSRSRVLKDETLKEATSMGDLSLRPQLSKGVENADYQAKRSFETYGGKDAMEPPFGRVPKRSKLEVIDFLMGSHLSDSIGRHQASTLSANVYF